MKSPNQIRAALLSFSDAKNLKLYKYAQWRMRPVGGTSLDHTAKELLEEAVIATIEGRRPWIGDIDLFTHLKGAMRSISINWRAKANHEYFGLKLIWPDGSMAIFPSAATLIGPKNIYSARKDMMLIQQLFANDQPAARIIQLLAQGYDEKEIQSQLNISPEEYATVARRFRRAAAPSLFGPENRCPGDQRFAKHQTDWLRMRAFVASKIEA